MSVRVALVLSLAVGFLPGILAGQRSAPPDPFERVAFLIGRWEGTSEGRPGKGTVRREYTRVLNSRFIRIRNRSEYPVQERNPQGEVHEDEGFISADEFEEIFELAESGKPFEVYSRTRLKRVR